MRHDAGLLLALLAAAPARAAESIVPSFPVPESELSVPDKPLLLRYVRRDAATRCLAHAGAAAQGIADLSARLNGLAASEHEERAALHNDIAQLHASEADGLPMAAFHFRKAYEEMRQVSEEKALAYLGRLGIVEQRLGELANCIRDHNGDSCILPLTPRARHKDRAGSEAAIKTFMAYLDKRPGDLHVQWLLNIAHMTLGSHPDGVPPRYRVPERLYAGARVQAFENLAPELGLDAMQRAGGALMEDLDGDGDLDLVMTSFGPCDPVVLYLNDGKGGFRRAADSGLESQLYAVNVIQGDYDNDGDADLYLARGTWELRGTGADVYGTPVYNSLMRNDGRGRFTDVTAEAGMLPPASQSSLAAAWGDLDNDGRLDLVACNEARDPDVFWNRGGSFQLWTSTSGIYDDGICRGLALGDVDDDGDLDLFMANWGSDNRLFLNRGDGSFERREDPVLDPKPVMGYVSWFFDYDNDGRLDLFSGAYSRRTDVYVESLKGLPSKGESLRLFRNEGGTFRDATAELGLGKVQVTMSGNPGDLDNDGYEDLYLGTGAFGIGDIMPNILYRNAGAKAFEDATLSARVGNLQKGHGIAWGDLDNDGDQDILAQLGGVSDADRSPPCLFINPGSKNDWATLRLEGTRSNRSAIGARVRIRVAGPGGERDLHRVVGSGGSFGSNSLQVEAGLGPQARILQVDVRWPGGAPETFRDVPKGRIVRLREGSAKPEVLDVPRIALRRGSVPRPHAHQ